MGNTEKSDASEEKKKNMEQVNDFKVCLKCKWKSTMKEKASTVHRGSSEAVTLNTG